MATAYVDSSALLAVAFAEPGEEQVVQRLAEYSDWVSSNLLEAEVRAAFTREGRDFTSSYVPQIKWVTPDRALSQEIDQVLRTGYVRGADTWHLAAALYATLEMDVLAFITLDAQQRRVAEALGFKV